MTPLSLLTTYYHPLRRTAKYGYHCTPPTTYGTLHILYCLVHTTYYLTLLTDSHDAGKFQLLAYEHVLQHTIDEYCALLLATASYRLRLPTAT